MDIQDRITQEHAVRVVASPVGNVTLHSYHTQMATLWTWHVFWPSAWLGQLL